MDATNNPTPTQDDIINTTAEWVGTIEIPGMPPNYRVPRAVAEAVLKTAVDAVIYLNDGGEPVRK